MPAPASYIGTPTRTRLETSHDIRTRYSTVGPHVTAVVPVPVPGTVGDDFALRWNATKADLHHLGASEHAIGHMDALIATTQRRGLPLLVTANDESAAACWLGYDIEPSMIVGPFPALLPALRQVQNASSPTVAAAVDRIGADVYLVDSLDISRIATVDGEDEQIHKAASGGRFGGWSQNRHQRHSEVLWERNAALVAAEIASQVADVGAEAIVLTGDERAVRLVESDLQHVPVDAVTRRRVGGRHEPGTAGRLLGASLEERRNRATDAVERELMTLREELGQHDRAIDGAVHVLEAITENRVGALFVDFVEGRHDRNVDSIVRAALEHGARVIIGDEFAVHDGIAALLRAPYR